MKRMVCALFVITMMLLANVSKAAACTPTGFVRDGINMTAAMINPSGTVTGTVDAAGCNIGVYYDANGLGGTVKAEVKNSNYFGVLVNGDAGPVAVDVLNSNIHDIGEVPPNGTQHGVAIYYRAFTLGGSATGKISGNQVWNYQKGGIVVNGQGANAVVSNNTVTGQGRVNYIAMNGIQFGYGSSGSAMKNTVSGNAYTGTNNASSGGIIVVGGDCYSGAITTGIQIVQNIVTNNDVGVWLSNLDASCNAVTDQTNEKVVNNTISNDSFTNISGNVTAGYQAGVADQGTNDKIINNTISGAGYQYPGVAVDADPSFTNKPKVHANQ